MIGQLGGSLNEDLNRNARGKCDSRDSNTKELNGFSCLPGGTIADDVAVAEECIVGVDDEGPPDTPDLQHQLPL